MQENQKSEQLRTTVAKQAMIKALQSTLGIVTPAAKQVGITGETHRVWMLRDEEYRREVLSIKMQQKDYVESKLMEQIDNNDTACIIYANKSLNRDRGYGDVVVVAPTKVQVPFEDMPLQDLLTSIDSMRQLMSDNG